MSHSTNLVINIAYSDTIIEMNFGTRKVSEFFGVSVGEERSFTNQEAIDTMDVLLDNDFGVGQYNEQLLNVAKNICYYEQDVWEVNRRDPEDEPIDGTYVTLTIKHFD